MNLKSGDFVELDPNHLDDDPGPRKGSGISNAPLADQLLLQFVAADYCLGKAFHLFELRAVLKEQ
jgi:hypothetical protein